MKARVRPEGVLLLRKALARSAFIAKTHSCRWARQELLFSRLSMCQVPSELRLPMVDVLILLNCLLKSPWIPFDPNKCAQSEPAKARPVRMWPSG